MTETHDGAGGAWTGFARKRDQVLKGLETVGRLAEDLGEGESKRLCEALAEKLRREQFHVIVLGEFNRGKSTFINALLGAPVLPVAVRPTTAAINIIRYGETPRAVVSFRDGREEEVPIETLSDYVVVAGAQVSEVKWVTVHYPTELCRNGVLVVDTPGVNDIDEQREEITYDFIPKSDAAILLLDCETPVSGSERNFLADRVLRSDIPKIFFVLNKADQLDEEELAESLDYARGKLGELVEEPRLFPLSSKGALKARQEGHEEELAASRLPAFEKELSAFLEGDKGRVILQSPVGKLRGLGGRLRRAIDLERRGLDMDEKQIEGQVTAMQPVLAEHSRRLEGILERLEDGRDRLKALFGSDLDEGLHQVYLDVETVVKQSAIDAEFVKHVLPATVRKRMQEFLESEQGKIEERIQKQVGRAIDEAEEILSDLDTVLADRFSLDRRKLDMEHLFTITEDRSGGEFYVYEVGGLVGGGLTVLLSTVFLGPLGIIPGVFGARALHRIVQDHRQEKMQEDLLQAVEKALGEVKKRLRDEAAGTVDRIYGQLGDQLGQWTRNHMDELEQQLARVVEQSRRWKDRGAERRGALERVEATLERTIHSLDELLRN